MRSWGVFVIPLIAASPAWAGIETVRFDPQVYWVEPGGLVDFDVYLFAATLGDIQGADILFWSQETAFDFTYSSAWLEAMVNPSPLLPPGIFPNDIFAGGNNPPGPIGAQEILFGTITVDTWDWQYPYEAVMQVDGTLDGFSQILLGAEGEPAVGMGIIRIPEPGCVVLLCVGTLALVRRRGPHAISGMESR